MFSRLMGTSGRMDEMALIAAVATVIAGTVLVLIRFRHQGTPVGTLTLHVTLGLVGLVLWALYVFGSQRDDELGAIVSGLSLLGSAVAGAVMFWGLRGRFDFGVSGEPPRSLSARGLILVHGLLALATLVLVAIEAGKAWRASHAAGPDLDVGGDLPSLFLVLAWSATGVVVSLLGQLYAKRVNARASTTLALLFGAIGGFLGGMAASLAPGLPEAATIVAAALGGVAVWWFRMIAFAGFQDEPEP
jgi:hypothetical protein